MSRRRKAERPSQASADEAVRRTSVEQGSDTPGTLQGGKEARQARLESRIRAGPHRKRWGASQRSQLGLHRPGQLIDGLGVVNPVGGQPCGEMVSQSASIPRAGAFAHPAGRAWSRRAACRPVPGHPAGLDGERRPRREEGPQRKPLVRRRTKCRRWGGIHPPESSGAGEVAPDALGVDDASVVSRGPPREGLSAQWLAPCKPVTNGERLIKTIQVWAAFTDAAQPISALATIWGLKRST